LGKETPASANKAPIGSADRIKRGGPKLSEEVKVGPPEKEEDF